MSAEFNSLDEFSEVQIDAWVRLGSDTFGRSVSEETLKKSVEKTKEIKEELSHVIGDVNSDEKGSGARYNHGKPDYSLIPFATLADEARVWAYGKAKYSAWNWAKGMDWSVPFACMMRHMSAWQAGEEKDQESGLPHLAHAMCNLRMLTLFAQNYPEGDTRPVKWLADYRNDVKKGDEL